MRGGCVFLQSVLLFSVGNERRIRVLTRPLQVVEHLPRLAQSIHLPTCLSLQTKQAAAALAKQPAKAVADKLQADAVAALSAQRELLPPPFQKVADAMFLTQTLALLPLFTLALARLPSLNPLPPQSLSLSPDAAAAQLLALRLLPPHLASRILLPRVHALHLRSEADGFLAPPPPPAAEGASATAAPPATAATATAAATAATAAAAAADGAAGASALAGWRELPMPSGAAVAQDGVYLLDSLEQLVLWVGAQAHPAFLEGLFGTATPADGAAPLPAAATPQVRAARGARSAWHTRPSIGAGARASLGSVDTTLPHCRRHARCTLRSPSCAQADRCPRRSRWSCRAARASKRSSSVGCMPRATRPSRCTCTTGRSSTTVAAARGTRPPAAWWGTDRAASRYQAAFSRWIRLLYICPLSVV